MKIEKTTNGNVLIKNNQDEIMQVIVSKEVFLQVHPRNDKGVLISKTPSNQDEREAIVLYADQITQINDNAFSGNRNDLLQALSLVFKKGGADGVGSEIATSKPPITLFEGKLLGSKSVTFAEDLTGYTSFLVLVKFYSHFASSMMPIQAFDKFAIMCPMSNWFTNNKRAEIGTYEIAYNPTTKEFKVNKAFYRQSDNWKKENLRNNNSTYYIGKIIAM